MLLHFASCHLELADIQITVLMEAASYRDENTVEAKHLTYTFNPSTQEAMAGLSWVQGQPGMQSKTLFQKQNKLR